MRTPTTGTSKVSNSESANAHAFNHVSGAGARATRPLRTSPAPEEPRTAPETQRENDAPGDPSPGRPTNGYLIEPAAQSITPWVYNGDYRTIRHALGIDPSPFTIVQIQHGDVIFVDDEGLLKPLDWFFGFKGYHQPIAGRGLVLGTDRDGEAVSARITLDELKARVVHLRIIDNSPPPVFRAWAAGEPALTHDLMTLRQVMAWTQDLPRPPPAPSSRLH